MTAVAAPGKVLLSGGYLVLEQPHPGWVVALSAHFHAILRVEPTPPTASEGGLGATFTVSSAQFGAEWQYVFRCAGTARLCQLDPRAGDGPNPFIAAALLASLAVVCGTEGLDLEESLAGKTFHITLQADNPFYSQGAYLSQLPQPLTPELLRAVPPANPALCEGGGPPPKTGLGSSACLVTALVACVMHHFGAAPLPLPRPAAGPTGPSDTSAAALAMIHAVAQLSHCYAQGKVGSGFDVCAAVYGSGVYARFAPQVLDEGMAVLGTGPVEAGALCRALGLGGVPKAVGWDHAFEPFGLPAPLTVMLADIRQGSSSPGMASAVLRWRAAAPEAERVWWTELAELNRALIAGARALSGHGKKQDYATNMAALAQRPVAEWPEAGPADLVAALLHLRDTSAALRQRLRDIGAACGVPIEPPAQTALLEATLALPGVLFGGVPGAGGFDALYVVLVHPAARGRVEAHWLATAPAGTVLPLLVEEGGCGVALSAP